MKLNQFRVRAFRCIHDTGNVKVADTAALIGKNESGKTAILEALAHLNKDLPINGKDICDELIDRLQPDDRIVEGRFSLTESEKALVVAELPDVTIEDVVIFRRYGSNNLEYEFPNAIFPRKHATIERGIGPFKDSLRSLATVLKGAISAAFAGEVDAEKARAETATLKTQFDELFSKLLSVESFEFRKIEPVFKQLLQLTRQKFRSVRSVTTALELTKKAFRQLFVMMEYPLRAKLFLGGKLHPRLLYFAEYKVIDGIIDVAQYLQAKDSPRSRTDVGYQFQKTETVRNLFHLAQLDPKQLEKLATDPSSLRSELVRSSRRLTEMLALTWKGKKIDVRLDFSNGVLTVEVADIYQDGTTTNRGLLDRRSAGFKWHFSFFVNFRAGTQQSAFKDAILLLDEPGLNLHPEQQAGLVDVIRDLSQTNQVLYTTHSPFMIYNFDSGSLLIVEFDPTTKASRIRRNFWDGDWQTIRPILHSIGDTVLLKVFFGGEILPAIVVVEGKTDHLYLIALAGADIGDTSAAKLRRAEPLPSGGNCEVKERALHYQKRKWKVVALFDSEPAASKEVENLLRSGFPKEGVVRVGSDKNNADIEDLFTRDDYLTGVNEFYASKLRDAKNFKRISKQEIDRLTDEDESRIVKALDKLFASHASDNWGSFDKAGVCEYICERIVSGGMKVSAKTRERFDQLFGRIGDAVEYWEKPSRKSRRKSGGRKASSIK